MLPIEHNRTLGNIEHNRTLHATIELKASFMRCVQISYGRDPFNQNSNRSDREKWSTSKGGPVFSKLFRLDRTDPLSFGPKFSEILVEWIAPINTPTGVKSASSTLTDVIFTNYLDRVVCSSVSHVSLSDHSLVYVFREVSIDPSILL